MSEDRKKDHIELAFKSRPKEKIDLGRMSYEPLLAAHPERDFAQKKFLGSDFGMPLWVSSMTGGTERAKKINQNLARACEEFKLAMGLGSCRPLLENYDRLNDFNIKELMPTRPLYTNFGIAQLEELAQAKQLKKLAIINSDLGADGLIIHVNPLQEWAQPEGDRYKKAPIDTIKEVLDAVSCKIIVKEVGQGFGPKSLKLLLDLPIAAIEFGAFGGTNFTILEQARHISEDSGRKSPRANFGFVGHSAEQMIGWLNELSQTQNSNMEFIISGGISDAITGHRLIGSLNGNSVVGMASELLRNSMGEYEELQAYLIELQESFALAKAYIRG